MFAFVLVAALAGLAFAAGRSAPGGRAAPPLPLPPVDANGFRVFGTMTADLLHPMIAGTPAGMILLVDLVDASGAVWRTIPIGGATSGDSYVGKPFQAPAYAPASYPFAASEVASVIGYVPAPTRAGA